MHSNTRAGWLVSEVLLVDPVHLGEIIHGSQERRYLSQVSFETHYVPGENTYFNNAADRATRSLENLLDAFTASGSLVRDTALDQLA